MEKISDPTTMSELYNYISSNNNRFVSSVYKTRRTLQTDDTVSEVKSEADKFQKQIRKLNNYKTSTHQDSKLIRDITSFVKEYNTFKKKTLSTKNEEVDSAIDKIDELITENKKTLKKIGVSISDSGYLSFDSEDFDDVEKKDLQELFSGTDSFINKTNKIIRDLKNNANEVSEEFLRYHPVTTYTKNEITTAGACIDMVNNCLPSLVSADYDENINNKLETFVNCYNLILSNASSSSYKTALIEQVNSDSFSFKDNLNSLGITFENNSLVYNQNNVDEDAAEKFEQLFKVQSFPDNVEDLTKSIYLTSLKTNSINVTVTDATLIDVSV